MWPNQTPIQMKKLAEANWIALAESDLKTTDQPHFELLKCALFTAVKLRSHLSSSLKSHVICKDYE